MAHTTEFVGYVDIAPALNQHEIDYLTAFCRSLRFDRPDGPYAVPTDPAGESDPAVDDDVHGRIASGQPSLWCAWTPSPDGSGLAHSHDDRADESAAWLRYLLQHFLKPGARASRTGLPAFEHFTFDHRLDGLMVGYRRESKDLFAIQVRANRVSERILRAGRQADWPGALPRTSQIAPWQSSSPRRRAATRDRPPAVVVDLASRRTFT